MPSRRRLTPVVGRDGISSREHEISTVEIDTTFGRVLGLVEGQTVRQLIPVYAVHADPG